MKYKNKNKNWEVSVKQERRFYKINEGSQFLVSVPDILVIVRSIGLIIYFYFLKSKKGKMKYKNKNKNWEVSVKQEWRFYKINEGSQFLVSVPDILVTVLVCGFNNLFSKK